MRRRDGRLSFLGPHLTAKDGHVRQLGHVVAQTQMRTDGCPADPPPLLYNRRCQHSFLTFALILFRMPKRQEAFFLSSVKISIYKSFFVSQSLMIGVCNPLSVASLKI